MISLLAEEKRLEQLAQRLPADWTSTEAMSEAARSVAQIPEWDNAAVSALMLVLRDAGLVEVRRRTLETGHELREMRRNPSPPELPPLAERLRAADQRRAAEDHEREERERELADEARRTLQQPWDEFERERVRQLVQPLVEELTDRVTALEAALMRLGVDPEDVADELRRAGINKEPALTG